VGEIRDWIHFPEEKMIDGIPLDTPIIQMDTKALAKYKTVPSIMGAGIERCAVAGNFGRRPYHSLPWHFMKEMCQRLFLS
jgi:hypothetical protein